MELSHIDASGGVAMVDVSDKGMSKRKAVATGQVRISESTAEQIKRGLLKKGDPLACARIAGIMAAKKTADLIPLCHPLPVEHVTVDFQLEKNVISMESTVTTVARTGVEMEALVAVSAAALTIYDMCKAVDKHMVIGEIRLKSKTKGPVE